MFVVLCLGGGGGRIYSDGRSVIIYGGIMGNGSEGGKAFLNGGFGVMAKHKTISGGFGGGGGGTESMGGGGGGRGYSGGSSGNDETDSCGGGGGSSMLEWIRRMNAVIMQMAMVR